MTRGIYSIRNRATGDLYIGSSRDVEYRWEEHRSYLRKSLYGNTHFQRAWNKYGEEAFEFKCIDEVEDDRDLLEVEQWWLDVFWPTGYNIKRKAEGYPSMLGRSHTEETKERMRQAYRDGRHGTGMSGKHHSEETRKKIGELARGRVLPTRGKSKGTQSSEHREKNRQAHLGKSWGYHSEESKSKIRQALTGRPGPRLGKKTSEETKEKIRQSRLETERRKKCLE